MPRSRDCRYIRYLERGYGTGRWVDRISPREKQLNEYGMQLPPPFDRSPGADPDQSNILITASFGALLPPSLLARFPLPHTRLNVHPSLLPRLRGAAPIQWSLVRSAAVEGEAGDTAESKETGVCVQCLARGMDTGDLFGLRAGIVRRVSEDTGGHRSSIRPPPVHNRASKGATITPQCSPSSGLPAETCSSRSCGTSRPTR